MLEFTHSRSIEARPLKMSAGRAVSPLSEITLVRKRGDGKSLTHIPSLLSLAWDGNVRRLSIMD